MPRPHILFFTDWFFPGYKGGGSQLAAVNLVQSLSDEFDFHVVTRDRDAGEKTPFPNIEAGRWISTDGFRVLYLAPNKLTQRETWNILRSTPHDLLHLNSVVSFPFGIFPLIAHNWTEPEKPVLVSPHGEASPHALMQKRWRKMLYLRAARSLGNFRNTFWHAASAGELIDVKRAFGESARITVTALLPPRAHSPIARKEKQSGKLAAVFLARVDRMKNLHLAIEWVTSVPGATLDIYGPVGQVDYWAECHDLIARSERPEAFRYHGGVSSQDVISVLSGYDLLVQPSQSENFGYSILEALIAGCPVLLSDRTPWRGLEKAGVGFDIPLEKPSEFHRALMQMRDLSEPTYSLWRDRAHAYAMAYIERSSAKAAVRAMYATLLNGV